MVRRVDTLIWGTSSAFTCRVLCLIILRVGHLITTRYGPRFGTTWSFLFGRLPRRLRCEREVGSEECGNCPCYLPSRGRRRARVGGDQMTNWDKIMFITFPTFS